MTHPPHRHERLRNHGNSAPSGVRRSADRAGTEVRGALVGSLTRCDVASRTSLHADLLSDKAAMPVLSQSA